MDETLTELGEYVTQSLGADKVEWYAARDELTFVVGIGHLVETMRFLHDDQRCQFISFIDLCGVDWPGRERRFDVVYHLLSPKQNLRVRIKVACDEDEVVPSVTAIWPAANWFEREAYDLYGILFSDHPDLRRILTDYGFEGHPLRKDFPLTGFVEVRYDEELKRVVNEPVRLTQEFRTFDFLSPWEGTDYILPGDEKASEGRG